MYNDRQQQQSVTIQVSAIEGIQMPQQPMPAPMAPPVDQNAPMEAESPEGGPELSQQGKTAFVAALEAIRQYHMAKDPAEKAHWKTAADNLHQVVLQDSAQMLSCKVEYTALLASDPSEGVGGKKPGPVGNGPKVKVPPDKPATYPSRKNEPAMPGKMVRAFDRNAPKQPAPTAPPQAQGPANVQQPTSAVPKAGEAPKVPDNTGVGVAAKESEQGLPSPAMPLEEQVKQPTMPVAKPMDRPSGNSGQLTQAATEETINKKGLNFGSATPDAASQSGNDDSLTFKIASIYRNKNRLPSSVAAGIISEAAAKPVSSRAIYKVAEEMGTDTAPSYALAQQSYDAAKEKAKTPTPMPEPYKVTQEPGKNQSPDAATPKVAPAPDAEKPQVSPENAGGQDSMSPQDINDMELAKKAIERGRSYLDLGEGNSQERVDKAFRAAEKAGAKYKNDANNTGEPEKARADSAAPKRKFRVKGLNTSGNYETHEFDAMDEKDAARQAKDKGILVAEGSEIPSGETEAPSETPQPKENSATEVQGGDKAKPDDRGERKKKYHDAFDQGTKPQSANGIGTARTAVSVAHDVVRAARSFVNGNFGDAAGHVSNAAATREGFRNDQKILAARKAEADGEKKRWDRVIDRANGLEVNDKDEKVALTTEEAVAARRAFKRYGLDLKKHLADAMGIPNAKELTSDELNIAADNYFNEKSPESRDKAELHDQMLQQNQKFVDRMDSDGTLTAAEARGFKNDLHNLTHDELKSLAESQGFSPYGSRKLLINQLKSKIDSHEAGRVAREKAKQGSKELLDEQVDRLKLSLNSNGEMEPEEPITKKSQITSMTNTFGKLSDDDKVATLKRMVDDPDEIDGLKGTGLNARFREEIMKHVIDPKTRGEAIQDDVNDAVAAKVKGGQPITPDQVKSTLRSLKGISENDLRTFADKLGVTGFGTKGIDELRVDVENAVKGAVPEEQKGPTDKQKAASEEYERIKKQNEGFVAKLGKQVDGTLSDDEAKAFKGDLGKLSRPDLEELAKAYGLDTSSSSKMLKDQLGNIIDSRKQSKVDADKKKQGSAAQLGEDVKGLKLAMDDDTKTMVPLSPIMPAKIASMKDDFSKQTEAVQKSVLESMGIDQGEANGLNAAGLKKRFSEELAKHELKLPSEKQKQEGEEYKRIVNEAAGFVDKLGKDLSGTLDKSEIKTLKGHLSKLERADLEKFADAYGLDKTSSESFLKEQIGNIISSREASKVARDKKNEGTSLGLGEDVAKLNLNMDEMSGVERPTSPITAAKIAQMKQDFLKQTEEVQKSLLGSLGVDDTEVAGLKGAGLTKRFAEELAKHELKLPKEGESQQTGENFNVADKVAKGEPITEDEFDALKRSFPKDRQDLTAMANVMGIETPKAMGNDTIKVKMTRMARKLVQKQDDVNKQLGNKSSRIANDISGWADHLSEDPTRTLDPEFAAAFVGKVKDLTTSELEETAEKLGLDPDNPSTGELYDDSVLVEMIKAAVKKRITPKSELNPTRSVDPGDDEKPGNGSPPPETPPSTPSAPPADPAGEAPVPEAQLPISEPTSAVPEIPKPDSGSSGRVPENTGELIANPEAGEPAGATPAGAGPAAPKGNRKSRSKNNNPLPKDFDFDKLIGVPEEKPEGQPEKKPEEDPLMNDEWSKRQMPGGDLAQKDGESDKAHEARLDEARKAAGNQVGKEPPIPEEKPFVPKKTEKGKRGPITTIRNIAEDMNETGDFTGFIAAHKAPEIVKAYFAKEMPAGPDKKVQDARRTAWDMVINQTAAIDAAFSRGAQPEAIEEFLDDITDNMRKGKEDVLEGTLAAIGMANRRKAVDASVNPESRQTGKPLPPEEVRATKAYKNVDPIDYGSLGSRDEINKKIQELTSQASAIERLSKNGEDEEQPLPEELADLPNLQRRAKALMALHRELGEKKNPPKDSGDQGQGDGGGGGAPKEPTKPKPTTPPAKTKPKSESEEVSKKLKDRKKVEDLLKKNPDALSDKATDDSEKDPSNRALLAREKQKEIQEIRDEAASEGYDPKALDEFLPEIKKEHNAWVKAYNTMLSEARASLQSIANQGRSLSGAKWKGSPNAKKIADNGGDGRGIKGIDTVAEELAGTYDGYGEYSGFFKKPTGETGSYEDQLFEMLAGGNMKPMSDVEAYKEALNRMMSYGRPTGDAGSPSITAEEVEASLSRGDDEAWKDIPPEGGDTSFDIADFEGGEDNSVNANSVANNLKTGGAVNPEEADAARSAYESMSEKEKNEYAKALGLNSADTGLASTRDDLVERKIAEGEYRYSRSEKGIEPELQEGGELFKEPGIGESPGLFDEVEEETPAKPKTESEEVSEGIKAQAARKTIEEAANEFLDDPKNFGVSGVRYDILYEAARKKMPDLTEDQFRSAMEDMRDDRGNWTMGGWAKTKDEIHNPKLAIPREKGNEKPGSNVQYYVQRPASRQYDAPKPKATPQASWNGIKPGSDPTEAEAAAKMDSIRNNPGVIRRYEDKESGTEAFIIKGKGKLAGQYGVNLVDTGTGENVGDIRFYPTIEKASSAAMKAANQKVAAGQDDESKRVSERIKEQNAPAAPKPKATEEPKPQAAPVVQAKEKEVKVKPEEGVPDSVIAEIQAVRANNRKDKHLSKKEAETLAEKLEAIPENKLKASLGYYQIAPIDSDRKNKAQIIEALIHSWTGAKPKA